VRAALDTSGPAAKLAAGLALVLALTAAVSYAAIRPGSGHGGERRAPGAAGGAPTLPVAASGSAALRIVGHPPTVSTRTTARFRIAATGEPTLRCRLDRRAAKPCAASVVYSGLGTGPHNFLVQAQRPGRASARAGFAWTVLEPKPFTVAPQPGTVGPLFPGATPSPVPLVISNPNPVAITVTALKVTVTGGAPGCDPGPNLEIGAPDLGRGKLRIPAHGTVSLPSAVVAAPTIGLRNLEVPQDACQAADFDLAFSGSAGS
jgi:hypothetical protein